METRTGPCLCGGPEKIVEENGRQVIEYCPLYIEFPVEDSEKGTATKRMCAHVWNAHMLRQLCGETARHTASINNLRNVLIRLEHEGQAKLIEGVDKVLERDRGRSFDGR